MTKETRRRFLRASAASGILLAAGCGSNEKSAAASAEPEVSPAEDLMREHGLLNRILLIYDEAARRLDASGSVELRLVSDAAGIIKRFIEEYHEKLEEDQVFPRFEKARKETQLVAVLRAQHDAGRRLTAGILQRSTSGASPESRKKLSADLRLFARMYRPHEAREDTVLFPALHQIVSAHEYDAMGEEFERKEHELFGKEGFEGMVARVAEIEKTLGIHDLGQFTPQDR